MENQLLQKLRQGKTMLGVCNMYPAAGIIEGMGKGWDFVWIDGQHGQLGYDAIANAVRAADLIGVDSLVRVPDQSRGVLGMVADLKPSAIMVPMTETAEQARHIVEAVRFPPLGKRSFGGRRVIDLGGREYLRGQEILLVLQIETLAGLEAVEQVAGVDGFECLFFGPDDMKMQLGLPVDTAVEQSKELREAMSRIARAAAKAGKICGCVAGNLESLKTAVSLGYRFLVGGADSGFLRAAAGQTLTQFRSYLASVS
jgi:2-keto-3-deoxy-L-rhamnonate aldolase RhmA